MTIVCFEYDRICINNFCSHLPTPPPLEIHSFSRMLVIFGIISYTQVIVHTLNVLHHRLNFHFIFICANWSTTKWRAINNMKIVLLVLFGTYAYKNDRPPYYNLYLGRSHDVKWVAYTTFDPKGSFRHCFIMFLFSNKLTLEVNVKIRRKKSVAFTVLWSLSVYRLHFYCCFALFR